MVHNFNFKGKHGGLKWLQMYRMFSHDVMEAILVPQNNEMAAMLLSQANPAGVQLFSYVNTVPINLHGCSVLAM